MPNLRDFLNFDRYLTPSIIRMFYLLQIILIGLFGVTNVLAAFGAMGYSFLTGLAWLLSTIVGTAVALVAARIVTEIIMVLFQNNENLAALRARADAH